MTERKFNAIFAENLTHLMALHDISQNELARQLGVSPTSVNNWCNGLKTPRMKMVDQICSFFHVLRADLINPRADHVSPETPLYSVAAGPGVCNDGYPSETIALRLDADQFCFTVRGRSMEPTLLDGDIVVVQITTEIPGPSTIALVRVNGDESTLKKVRREKNGLWLLADNMDVYPPRFFTEDEVVNLPVTIEGVVVKLIREL